MTRWSLVRGAERRPVCLWRGQPRAQQACPGLALQPHGCHSPSPSISMKQGREEPELQRLPKAGLLSPARVVDKEGENSGGPA